MNSINNTQYNQMYAPPSNEDFDISIYLQNLIYFLDSFSEESQKVLEQLIHSPPPNADTALLELVNDIKFSLQTRVYNSNLSPTARKLLTARINQAIQNTAPPAAPSQVRRRLDFYI